MNWRHSSKKWPRPESRVTYPSSVTTPRGKSRAGGAQPSIASTPTAGAPSWSRSRSTSPTRFARRHFLEERERRHLALQQTIAAVPGHNLVSSLQQVADALVPALPADVATLRLLDADAKLHLVAASGLRPAETRRLALDPITIRRLETMIEAAPASAPGIARPPLGRGALARGPGQADRDPDDRCAQQAASARKRPHAARRRSSAARQRPGEDRAEPPVPSKPFSRGGPRKRRRRRGRANPQHRPPPTRARDPPPLRRRTPNRPSRRTTRTLPAHSPDTRQERSPPSWRQLPSRGTRPSQGCRRRSLHVTEGRLERARGLVDDAVHFAAKRAEAQPV